MKPLRIHCLQHVPFEDAGCITNWINRHEHHFTTTRLYVEDNFPHVHDIDWLIILGGPMSVHDEAKHPWLKEEKKFINECIAQHKTILGICLGAQLIAHVCGADVYPNKEKEIGWFPVHKKMQHSDHPIFSHFPDAFNCFHWHGDTFDLPPDSIHLVYSKACANQAFLMNDNIMGLQFHLEATPELINEMLLHEDEDTFEGGEYVQDAEVIRANTAISAGSNRIMYELLNYLWNRYKN